MSKEDMIIYSISKKLRMINSIVLSDKFDFTDTKIRNVNRKILETEVEWKQGTLPSEDILKNVQKYVDITAYVKRLPMRKKLIFGNPKNFKVKGVDRFVEAAMISALMLTVYVLKKYYRFSKKEMVQYITYVDNYIDSFCKPEPKAKRYYLSEQDLENLLKTEKIPF